MRPRRQRVAAALAAYFDVLFLGVCPDLRMGSGMAAVMFLWGMWGWPLHGTLASRAFTLSLGEPSSRYSLAVLATWLVPLSSFWVVSAKYV